MTSQKKDDTQQTTTGQNDPAQTNATDTVSTNDTQTFIMDDLQGATQDPLLALQQALEAMTKEKDEYLNLLQRERADFINFRKRNEDEKKETIQFGQSMLLLRLIPIYELLNKAFAHLPAELKTNDWVEGVVNIKSLFDKAFTDMQVQKIETLHTAFDSTVHEAMMQVSGEKGMVIQELEAGYLFHGRCIKPARVSVGNGGEVQNDEQPVAEKKDAEMKEEE